MTDTTQLLDDIARELHTANQLAYLRQLQHDHEHDHELSELGLASVEWLRTEIYRALGHPAHQSPLTLTTHDGIRLDKAIKPRSAKCGAECLAALLAERELLRARLAAAETYRNAGEVGVMTREIDGRTWFALESPEHDL